MKHLKNLLIDRKFKIIRVATIGFVTLSMFFSICGFKTDLMIKEIDYPKFEQFLEENKIQTVHADFENGYKIYIEDIEGNMYKTDNPSHDNFKLDLVKKGISIEPFTIRTSQQIMNKVLMILSFGVFIAFGIFIFKIVSKNNNVEVSSIIGKPKSKKVTKEIKIRFNDIAGNEEAKLRVQTIVNFLKNPGKYNEMGAKLPKGILFYGPPGTGKTILAKAIAGEAGVPFFSVSGSDFVEKYVGVGASRVRALFEEAKQNAPCVIFIDEIDAVGSSRQQSGGNNEKDQTINALLTELDGFEDNSGIIVIAATNRLDMLDNALIRSGRFDQHICIELPQAKDRLKILQLYTKNKPIGLDVNLERLSKETQGFSGADLATLINNAAIFAVDRNQKTITAQDIEDAHNKIVLQSDRKLSGHEDKLDQELVAWHEAGHAIMTKLCSEDSVPKVTIMPTTSGVGGYAIHIKSKEHFRTKRDYLNDIMISYAGRVGELLLRNDEHEITTGASNDIKNATKKIKMLVEECGMSKTLGMLNANVIGEYIDKKEISNEIKELEKDLFEKTYNSLNEHRPLVETLALKLIEQETVYEEQLDSIINDYLYSLQEV